MRRGRGPEAPEPLSLRGPSSLRPAGLGAAAAPADTGGGTGAAGGRKNRGDSEDREPGMGQEHLQGTDRESPRPAERH